MKVLLVNGSPHKNGSTSRALKEISETLAGLGVESEIIWLGTGSISGCIGCGECRKIGKCVIEDSVNKFVEKAKMADGFVFGSPVHFAGITGNLKCFMDRVFYCGKKAFTLKPAVAVTCARRAGSTEAYNQIIKYFAINQMTIVSSKYWNMVFGTSFEEVEKDLEGMQTMRIVARNLAYVLKYFEAGKKAGIHLPKIEEKDFKTNFIN